MAQSATINLEASVTMLSCKTAKYDDEHMVLLAWQSHQFTTTYLTSLPTAVQA